MYVCICICVHVCMYVCVYVCVCMYMRTCVYVCMYVCMYVYVCICVQNRSCKESVGRGHKRVQQDFDESDFAQEVGDGEMDDVYEQQSDIGDQQEDMEEEADISGSDLAQEVGDGETDDVHEQQDQPDIGDQLSDSEADMEKKQQADIEIINSKFRTSPDKQPDIPDQPPRMEDDHPSDSDMEEEGQQLGPKYYQAHSEHAQRLVLQRAINTKHTLVFDIDSEDEDAVQKNNDLKLEVLENNIRMMRETIARRPSVNKLEPTCFLVENTNALCIERCDESSCDRNTSNEFRTLLLDRCASTGLPPSSSSSGSSSGASGALLDYYCMGIQHISMICFTYSATIFGYCINF